MRLGGADGNAQVVRNLHIRLIIQQKLQDVLLPWRELVVPAEQIELGVVCPVREGVFRERARRAEAGIQRRLLNLCRRFRWGGPIGCSVWYVF